MGCWIGCLDCYDWISLGSSCLFPRLQLGISIKAYILLLRVSGAERNRQRSSPDSLSERKVGGEHRTDQPEAAEVCTKARHPESSSVVFKEHDLGHRKKPGVNRLALSHSTSSATGGDAIKGTIYGCKKKKCLPSCKLCNFSESWFPHHKRTICS